MSQPIETLNAIQNGRQYLTTLWNLLQPAIDDSINFLANDIGSLHYVTFHFDELSEIDKIQSFASKLFTHLTHFKKWQSNLKETTNLFIERVSLVQTLITCLQLQDKTHTPPSLETLKRAIIHLRALSDVMKVLIDLFEKKISCLINRILTYHPDPKETLYERLNRQIFTTPPHFRRITASWKDNPSLKLNRSEYKICFHFTRDRIQVALYNKIISKLSTSTFQQVSSWFFKEAKRLSNKCRIYTNKEVVKRDLFAHQKEVKRLSASIPEPKTVTFA